MAEPLNRALFERLREEHHVTWGRPLRLLEITSSTNDLALEAIEQGMKTGGVFVAREQTQGRGRQGAPWQSPPGENLTFSVVIRFPKAGTKVQSYPLIVGLALHDALQKLFPTLQGVSIKWPNDLYAGSQKLAGILVEARSSAREHALAVGIGLNVETLDFGAENERRTSIRKLLTESGPAGQSSLLSKELILVTLLGALERRTIELVVGGPGAAIRAIRQADALLGKRIRTGHTHGTGAGIDDDGALLLLLETGEMTRISSGNIEVAW